MNFVFFTTTLSEADSEAPVESIIASVIVGEPKLFLDKAPSIRIKSTFFSNFSKSFFRFFVSLGPPSKTFPWVMALALMSLPSAVVCVLTSSIALTISRCE